MSTDDDTPTTHSVGWIPSQTFLLPAISNFSTAYNLSISGQVLFLISASGEQLSESSVAEVATAAFAGAILGQLMFGFIGDIYGPHVGLALTHAITVFGGVLSAIAPWGPHLSLILAVFRFVVGVGAGGVYPLSATSSAESSRTAHRGRSMILVFSLQGWGQFGAPFVIVLLDAIFPTRPEVAWRVALLVGAIPAAFLIPMALRGARAVPTRSIGHRQPGIWNAITSLATPRFAKNLAGTAASWFLFDVVFYGNILFTPFVLERVFHVDEATGGTQIAGYSALLKFVALPGFYLSALFADSWGRKRIQVLGFTMVALLFVVLALAHQDMSAALLFVSYCLTFLFYNFGPNATTFCLPSELFPHDVRSAYNGFSAATGKLGAVVGAAIFKPLLDQQGLTTVLYVCVVVSMLGSLVTVLLIDDRTGKGMVERDEDEGAQDAVGRVSDQESAGGSDLDDRGSVTDVQMVVMD